MVLFPVNERSSKWDTGQKTKKYFTKQQQKSNSNFYPKTKTITFSPIKNLKKSPLTNKTIPINSLPKGGNKKFDRGKQKKEEAKLAKSKATTKITEAKKFSC